jgi:hypothetical protein
VEIYLFIFGRFGSAAIGFETLRTEEHVYLSLHLKELVLHVLFFLLELLKDGDQVLFGLEVQFYMFDPDWLVFLAF